jgi:hypothetical protein
MYSDIIAHGQPPWVDDALYKIILQSEILEFLYFFFAIIDLWYISSR